MGKRPLRVPSDGRPYLDLFSRGRAGPQASDRFTAAQIEEISRTVRRVPEVMVKVTGGGRKIGAVAAHFTYISHEGEVDLETDYGQRVSREGQRELLQSWHLELSAGQYRQPRKGGAPGVKLVHNIVLSMPAPTPPQKVLVAATVFAREKFGAKHRYAMALHTHQQHPHVHLVVKAEGLDGRRLHIDKAMLREWRQDFARMMRDQGIAANATPRVVRGQTKRPARDAIFRAKGRQNSYALRGELVSIGRELIVKKSITDPARAKLLETRKAVIEGWTAVAAALEAQGEIALGGDVRYFAKHLPAVLTDRERLASALARHVETEKAQGVRKPPARERETERTR